MGTTRGRKVGWSFIEPASEGKDRSSVSKGVQRQVWIESGTKSGSVFDGRCRHILYIQGYTEGKKQLSDVEPHSAISISSQCSDHMTATVFCEQHLTFWPWKCESPQSAIYCRCLKGLINSSYKSRNLCVPVKILSCALCATVSQRVASSFLVLWMRKSSH